MELSSAELVPGDYVLLPTNGGYTVECDVVLVPRPRLVLVIVPLVQLSRELGVNPDFRDAPLLGREWLDVAEYVPITTPHK